MTRKKKVGAARVGTARVGAAPARREWRRKLLLAFRVTAVIAIAGTLLFTAHHYRDALPTWPEQVAPVQRVLVEGPFEHVLPTDVEEAVLPHLTGGFFTVNLDAIREAAERLAWVDSAQVVREWPDRVRIVVTEQRAAWRWGDDALLNERAELFVSGVDTRPAELPRLDGPAGYERQLAEQYLDLDARLAGCAMRVARAEVDPRRSLRLTLADGMVIRLGREEVDARVGRVCAVVAVSLAPRLDQVAYIDMRYTNGFAVGWRDDDAPANGREG